MGTPEPLSVREGPLVEEDVGADGAPTSDPSAAHPESVGAAVRTGEDGRERTDDGRRRGVTNPDAEPPTRSVTGITGSAAPVPRDRHPPHVQVRIYGTQARTTVSCQPAPKVSRKKMRLLITRVSFIRLCLLLIFANFYCRDFVSVVEEPCRRLPEDGPRAFVAPGPAPTPGPTSTPTPSIPAPAPPRDGASTREPLPARALFSSGTGAGGKPPSGWTAGVGRHVDDTPGSSRVRLDTVRTHPPLVGGAPDRGTGRGRERNQRETESSLAP